jgi:hypothetical protein
MPFVPAPNIVEVQLRATFDGQQVMNRIHVNVLHAPTEADCAAVAAAVGDWWDTNVQALVATNVVMREIYVKSVATANGPEATFSAGFPLVGTKAGDSLPNNVALAVSLRTGLTGRSARGRWYWYGITEDQVDANTMMGGTIASIDAAITNLLNEIEALGFLWVIVSYIANGGPRVGGPVYFTVNTITVVDSTVDSQRRRLPGRGR